MFRELQSIWRLYIHITYVSLRQGPQNELLRKQGVTASSACRHSQVREAVCTGQQKQGCHLTGLHFQVPATQETEVVTVQIQCLEPPAHGIHTAHRYAQTLHQGNPILLRQSTNTRQPPVLHLANCSVCPLCYV